MTINRIKTNVKIKGIHLCRFKILRVDNSAGKEKQVLPAFDNELVR